MIESHVLGSVVVNSDRPDVDVPGSLSFTRANWPLKGLADV